MDETDLVKSPLVEAEEVGKVFHHRIGIGSDAGRKFVRAVDRVSLTIGHGEIVGLVGESGCGKTTLGRLLIRLENPTVGRVLFDGKDITRLKGGALRRQRKEMQIIFQDPSSSLNPRLTIRETLTEAVLAHRGRVTKPDLNKRLSALIAMVGLVESSLDNYPRELSSGHRQNIAIARALAVEPRFIVADEPVSALDSASRSQIADLILELQAELQVSFLLISHDLDVVRRLSNRVAVMYLGRVVEIAEASLLFSDPKHPYSRALVAAKPNFNFSKRTKPFILPGDPPSPLDPPKGCHFHPRCAHAQMQCKLVEPPMREIEQGRFLKCHFDL
jgi:oligopeptide/dipeptide ABC transporter ATP-binding protein